MVRKGSGWGTPVTTTPPKGGKKKPTGGSWGTPVGGTSSKPKQQAPRDPQTELIRKVAQLQAVKPPSGGVTPQYTQQMNALTSQVREAVKGYKPKDIKKLADAASLSPEQRDLLLRANDQGTNPVEQGLGMTLDYANRPYNTITGALAEWSRQSENNPTDVGPFSLRFIPTDLGKIAQGAVNGLEGKTHESPLTIMQEAGKIRQKQGVGTKAFGVLPGTNIKKGEPLPYLGKAGGIAVDVAASIPVDPLSWITFGLSAEGRAGLRATERALGSERALDVAKGGVRVLDAEEKARLGANTVKLLKNTGGLGVRVPQPIKALREGKPMLGPGRTVVRTRGITEPLGRAASATAKAAEGVPVLGAPVRGAKNVYRSLERTFVPRAAILQAERDGRLPKGTAVALDESRVRAMGATHLAEADLNLLASGRKAAGLSEEENRALTSALEMGSKAALDERLSAAYDFVNDYRTTLAGEKRRVGLIGPEGDKTAIEVEASKKYDRAIKKAEDLAARLEKKRYKQSGNYANALGRLKKLRAEAAARGEELALVRAQEREAAINMRDVVEQSKQAAHDTKVEVIQARAAERDAQKTLGPLARGQDDIEREIARYEAIMRRAEPGSAAYRSAELKLRSLMTDWEATAARADEARQALTEAQAARQRAEEVAGRVSIPGRGAIPPRMVPREVRQTGTEVAAAGKLGKEEARLRILENLKASAAGRAERLASRRQQMVDAWQPILDSQYVPHVPDSPEAAQFLGQQERNAAMVSPSGPPTNVSKAPGGYVKSRNMRDTVENINAKLGANVESGRVFTEDPFIGFAKHGVEVRRDVATRDFLGEVQQLRDVEGAPLMRNVDDIPDLKRDIHGNAILPEGLKEVPVPGVGKFAVDEALAPEITKVTGLMTNDAHMKAWMSGLDKWMALWKGYATVPLPFGMGFHMRNATSNVMLNWLADISPTDPAYAEALGIQRRLTKGFKEGDPYKYLSGQSREIAQQALDHDILKSGFLVGNQDVPRDLNRPFESLSTRVGKGVNPINPDNWLIRMGRSFGSGIEENARLAHFINKYRTFGNAEDAAASVRKYLFDYNDLTAIEQNAFKRVMPFYTFTRKNTPLWIAAAVKQPGKYSRVAQWFNAFDEQNGMPGPVPSYMTEGGAFNTGVGGDTPWIATPDTPMGAAFKNVVNPAGQIAGVLPGGADEGFATLSQNFGGGLPGALKAVYDAYVQKRDPFTGKPMNDSESQRDLVASQLFPLLGKAEGIANPDKRQRRLLSMLTGIQATPYDKNVKNAAAWEKLDALIAYLAMLRKQGVDVGQLPGSNPNSTKKTPAGFGGSSSKPKGW